MDAHRQPDSLASDSPTETAAVPTYVEQRAPAQIGRYRILGRLGAGGMGTVYKAFDPQLERTVALKIPHFDGEEADYPALVQRFLREARAAAQIRHAGVCPIHDVGEHEGRPYAVMAYIDGESLAERLRGGGRYSDAAAACLAGEVAAALAAVHAHGLVHRDLKPGNILIDRDGRSLLTDFGLARPERDADKLTAQGVVVGTPAFMAPEQAAGESERIGPWTDVYGLGVVLYRLLTGQLPFQGTVTAVLRKIGTEDPPAPSTVRPDLDPALEAIVLRAMARQPEDRYPSGRELSAALEQWLEQAEITPTIHQGQTPARYPAEASSTALVTPEAATAGLTTPQPAPGPVSQTLPPDARPTHRPWALRRAGAALALLLVAGLCLLAVLPTDRHDPSVGKEPDLPKRKEGIVIPPASLRWRARAPLSGKALVSRPAPLAGLLGWTIETCQPRGPVRTLAYNPEGKVLAAAGDDGMVRLWQPDTKRLLRILVGHEGEVRGVAWSPDGRYLASASEDTTIRLWDADSGYPLQTLHGHAEGVLALAWSPDGTTLASAGGSSLRLWRLTGKEVQQVVLEHPERTLVLAWSPDSKTLATAGRETAVQLWDAATGRPLRSLEGGTFPYLDALAWSPDGKQLACGGQDGGVRLLDVGTGEFPQRIVTGFPVLALAWSRRGDRLATATVQAVQTWNTSGQLVCTLGRHDGAAHAIAWTADGKTLASAGQDGTVRFWSEAEGKALNVIPGHPAGPAGAAWSPDGKEVAVSGLGDGQLRLWDVAAARLRLLPGKCGPVASWSPSGKLLAVAGLDHTVQLWDGVQRSWLAPLPAHSQDILGLAWSRDSKRLASASADGTARVWHMPAGKLERELAPKQGTVFTVAWSADGATLGLGVLGALHLWQVDEDRLTPPVQLHLGPLRGLAWSPQGRLVATGGGEEDGLVVLRKAAGGDLLHRLGGDRAGVFSLAWSPDGKSLAAGGRGKIRLWNAADGEIRAELAGHTGPVRSLAWCAATHDLVSAGDEGSVRLWDIRSGRAGPLLISLRKGAGVLLSPDGHWAGPPEVEEKLVYVAQTEQGQKTLSPADFAREYRWKNDPARVVRASK